MKKQYDFEIVHTNGDTVEVSFVGVGCNLFSLKNGDLTTQSFTKTLISGVRSYRVLSIKNLGMQSQAEFKAHQCCNDLTQVSTPE